MAKKRYIAGGLIQLIDFANLLPPDAQLPEPRELDPEGKHATLLADLEEKFDQRFRPRRPLSRREQDAKARAALSKFKPKWKRSEADLREAIKRHTREYEYRSRNWSRFAPFFGYSYEAGQENTASAEASGHSSLRPRREITPLRLYMLFWTVRAMLFSLAEAGRQVTEGQTADAMSWPLPPVDPFVYIEPDGTARMATSWDDFHDTFPPALEGADVRRIKTCPACGKLFWANPSHKGACDDHLGLVRIWKYRAKQKDYEQTRKLKGASK